jgi:two-component system chemotaxis response regulator CheY
MTELKSLGYENFDDADCVDKAKLLCMKNPPDLIFSDWNMPQASGLDLIKFIRSNEKTKDIPFIMLTSDTERSKIIDATRAGIQCYIVKPIKRSVLIEKMSELSTAYGFKPPMNKILSNSQEQPVINQPPPAKFMKVKKEHIPKIMDAYEKAWKQELTIIGFGEFISKEICECSIVDNVDNIKIFIDTIVKTAKDAVENRLNQLSE